jgi:hypothetical protein
MQNTACSHECRENEKPLDDQGLWGKRSDVDHHVAEHTANPWPHESKNHYDDYDYQNENECIFEQTLTSSSVSYAHVITSFMGRFDPVINDTRWRA